MNLKQLEKIIIEHLKESGEIRADLKWLKKSYWALAGVLTLIASGLLEEAIRRAIG